MTNSGKVYLIALGFNFLLCKIKKLDQVPKSPSVLKILQNRGTTPITGELWINGEGGRISSPTRGVRRKVVQGLTMEYEVNAFFTFFK